MATNNIKYLHDLIEQAKVEYTHPRIIFQENPQNTDCCVNSLGTYIVNGGNCSPVISFTPQTKWIKSGVPAGGGATTGAASGNSKELIKPTNPKIERVGPQTGPSVQQHEWMWRMPGDMMFRNADAIAAHIEANSKYEEKQHPMSGELKIIGNPNLHNSGSQEVPGQNLGGPAGLIGKTIAIIVINPFLYTSSFY